MGSKYDYTVGRKPKSINPCASTYNATLTRRLKEMGAELKLLDSYKTRQYRSKRWKKENSIV